jgi:hypothetical protein
VFGAVLALLAAGAITLSSKLPKSAAALEAIQPSAEAPGRPGAALSAVNSRRFPPPLVCRGIGRLPGDSSGVNGNVGLLRRKLGVMT